ncbi:Receptor-like protein kinase ANXUR1 [Hordeum vulgare]|nr:Receptor-like protein kinase ANXUR1 [Hordeum vulgare]
MRDGSCYVDVLDDLLFFHSGGFCSTSSTSPSTLHPRAPLLSTLGLDHLHSLAPPLIHKVFNTSNVLVNENFIAKVSDTEVDRLLRRLEDPGSPLNGFSSGVYQDPESARFDWVTVSGLHRYIVQIPLKRYAKLQDVLPSIINQLAHDNMEHLKRIAEEMQKQVAAAGTIQPKEIDLEFGCIM